MLHLKVHFTATNDDGDQPDAAAGNTVMMQWYGSNRETLRQGRRFLANLYRKVEKNGWIHAEQWKDSIVKGFGVEFYELLNKWAPMSVDAIRLAEHLDKHSKAFKAPLPASIEMPASPTTESTPNENASSADPALLHQMVTKLISLQDQHLAALAQSYEQRSATLQSHDSSIDFSPRYFTTATRDLHRAVDWFQYLKRNNV